MPFQKKALYAGSEKLFKMQTDEQKQTFPCFFQVSWLKRHGDTPHLLTFGLTTYSNDARIQVRSCLRRMREGLPRLIPSEIRVEFEEKFQKLIEMKN